MYHAAATVDTFPAVSTRRPYGSTVNSCRFVAASAEVSIDDDGRLVVFGRCGGEFVEVDMPHRTLREARR